jgi:predicted enzyme related to lactoylglutathione lyase
MNPAAYLCRQKGTMAKTKNPVVHFEIGCRDLKRTRSFFSKVFDWEISQSAETPSLTIQTGSERGISGHITSLGHEPHHYINVYIEVDDVTAYLKKIEAEGGTVHVGPIDLPDGRTFAWFKDPDDNLLALITPSKGS